MSKVEDPVPDFYIYFNHPENPGEICHIPCRELDLGEIFMLDQASQDKYPEYRKDIPRNTRDMTKEQREWYAGYQKDVDAINAERNISATELVILQPGWTEALIRNLPKRTHRDAYMGGTAVMRETDPAVEAFLQASNQRTQTDQAVVPGDAADE